MHFLQLSVLAILLMLQQTCNRGGNQNYRDLQNSQWELVSIDGQGLDSALKSPTLLFEADGAKVNGFAGCNRFFGTYALTADSLTFSGLGATKMFCEKSQELENNYLSGLESVNGFSLGKKGETLTLLSDGEPRLAFDRTMAGQ